MASLESKLENKQEMLQALQADLEVLTCSTYLHACIARLILITVWLTTFNPLCSYFQRGQRDLDKKYSSFESQLKQKSEELQVNVVIPRRDNYAAYN